MSTVKISPGGQVRVPKDIMEKLRVTTGDYLDFEEKKGTVLVKGKKLVDADQAWFWTEDWQRAEREADEGIKAGRVSKAFTSAEEGIKHLREKRREYKGKKGRR